MSHSTGAVKAFNGKIYYTEYNGTVDVMLPNLYDTYEEMHNNWREQKWKRCDNKLHLHTRARIASSYGFGFSWNGMIYVECKVITDIHSPDNHEHIKYKNGLPEWFPNRETYKL